MNKLEKIVYDVVKGNQRLKTRIRNIYQSIYDFLPDKENYSISPMIVKEGFFFGFHDISPFSNDGSRILSNKLSLTEEPMRMPCESDPLIVGYWDAHLSIFTTIAQTYAWNYHKGCRLQWFGSDSRKVVFNDTIENRLCASIIDLDLLNKKIIDYPVDTVSHNGKFATSFSYERLNKYMPGYGYVFKDEPYFNEPDSENTGLYLIDIENNTRKLIVSLQALAAIEPDSTMAGAHHYVTHTEFSPDDKRIAFLHRWTFDDPDNRFTRLISCKLDGSDIQVSATTGMVSHYCWDAKHGVLAYCRVNDVDGHYIFTGNNLQNPVRVALDLNSDGHQSYVPGSELFVTDTYPDKRRYAKIYLSNINTKSSKLIVDVKSPKKFQSPTLDKHWACDLHPRVSPDGKKICFDSVHTGKRSLCLMDLDQAESL